MVLLLFLVFMGGPVLAVMGKGLTEGMGAAFRAQSTWTLYRNTVVLGLSVTLVSSTLALLLAWAMVKARMADSPVIRLIWLVPFMAPPYLMSMGWILFMEPNGYLAQLAPALTGLEPHFFSLWGLVCIMSLHLFPIPFVPALEAIRSVMGKYDIPARAHGGDVRYRWRKIWLPLTGPAVIGSSMLVFVKTIGEFGTPLVFGSMVHFPVLTTAIYLKMTTWPINFHSAAQLSFLLLGTVFLAWLLHDGYLRRKTPFGVESVVAEAPGPRRWNGVWGHGFLWLLGLVSMGIPIGSLVLTSALRVQGIGVHWSNLSWLHYRHIFRLGGDAMTAMSNSLELGAVAATLVVAVSILLAIWSRFYRDWGMRLTEWLGWLPNAIPDVLLAIGLILFWNSPKWPMSPYETPAILVIGFGVVLFPFAYGYIRVALSRLSPTVWEAALTHQATRWQTAWRVVAPLTGSALISGWMVVFGVSLRDLVVPMLLSPPDTTVISTYIYGQYDQGSLPDAMALGVATLVITVVLFSMVQWLERHPIVSDKR